MANLFDDGVEIEDYSDDDIRILDDTPAPIPADNSSVVDGGTSRKKRKRTSTVWEFFERIGLQNGKGKCKCKGCGKLFGSDSSSGTSHLIRHADKCRKLQKELDVRVMFSEASLKSKASKLDEKKFRRAIAEATVFHDLPFRFCEYSKIRAAFTILNPEFSPFSRNTMVKEINALYDSEKQKLKNTLAMLPSRICLTSDLWTAITNEGYISLTAHFVDNDWVLRSKILNFCSFPPPHTGQNLANTVMNFLKDWGIEKKISTITLDNASANGSMVAYLKEKLRINNYLLCNGDYFHVRCCAHILNLIVQEGLKVGSEALSLIRGSVLYVKSSESRMRQFKECVHQCYGQDQNFSLCTDVSTRWNSTYLMLRSAIKYRNSFQMFSTMDQNFEYALSYSDWQRVEKICDFLEPFYEITNVISGSSYPTSNIFFSMVVKVENLLLKCGVCDDLVMVAMAMKMKSKFDKYWHEYSALLAFGTILDPRCKLDEVANVLSQFDFESGGIDFTTVQVDKMTHIENELRRLYQEYHETIRKESQIGVDNTQKSTLTPTRKSGKGSSWNIFKGSSSRQRYTPKSELDEYLSESIMHYDEFEDLDVLQYWKTHSVRFPTLSRMAIDLLSIPITTVASESAFNIGSRVLTKFRSSILPDNVQAIICTRNWLRGFEGKL